VAVQPDRVQAGAPRANDVAMRVVAHHDRLVRRDARPLQRGGEEGRIRLGAAELSGGQLQGDGLRQADGRDPAALVAARAVGQDGEDDVRPRRAQAGDGRQRVGEGAELARQLRGVPALQVRDRGRGRREAERRQRLAVPPPVQVALVDLPAEVEGPEVLPAAVAALADRPRVLAGAAERRQRAVEGGCVRAVEVMERVVEVEADGPDHSPRSVRAISSRWIWLVPS
jgi:hypothetical protein